MFNIPDSLQLETVKRRVLDALNVSHSQFSCVRLRKNFNGTTAPRPSIKQFIGRSHLNVRDSPLKSIKILTDGTTIPREANRSSRTSSALTSYTKSQNTPHPLSLSLLDRTLTLEVSTRPAYRATVGVDAPNSLCLSATQKRLRLMSPEIDSGYESKGEDDESGDIPLFHMNHADKPTNIKP